MKFQKTLTSILAFVLALSVSISPLTSYASDTSLTPEQIWDNSKEQLKWAKAIEYNAKAIGVVLNPSKWGSGELGKIITELLIEDIKIDSSDSLDAYLNAHYSETTDSNGKLIYHFDPTLSNDLRNAFDKFIKANSPHFKIFDTTSYLRIPAQAYDTKSHYDLNQSWLKTKKDCLIDGLNPNDAGDKLWTIEEDILFFVEGRDGQYDYANAYNSDWEIISAKNGKYGYEISNGQYVEYNISTSLLRIQLSNYGHVYKSVLDCSYKDGKPIMVFESREMAIDYLTGHRDVYTGSKWGNYVGGDVSISQDQIDNSVTYQQIDNSVTTIINNNGGITAEELLDIINSLIDSGNPDGSGSGGSGSDGPSWGLSALLDGLGKLLDGVLAILGKLLEYIGKAIELFTDLIGKALDVIPKGFTDFLSALFPFIPQEVWIPIELMLGLSLILMLFFAFKK